MSVHAGRRIAGLDSLRGIAALIVLCTHVLFLGGGTDIARHWRLLCFLC
jgi:peptidoglycan/LPS O-acetylase OafA/YrhL